MASNVKLDPIAVATLFRSEHAPVMRHVTTVGTRVQTGAKERVGYDAEKVPGEEGGEHLRDTIVKRFVTGPEGPSVWVGSSHPRARLHHDGTQPHVIVPRKGRVLRFVVNGQVVYARRVQHPGTDPNPYLIDAAVAEGLRVTRLNSSLGGGGVIAQ